MNLEEFLILEKRISQISSSIEVIFSFDIIKTKHAEERQNFDSRGLGKSMNYISNREMSEFVSLFKRDIAQSIAIGDIKDETNFVIRSNDWQLSMAIVAKNVENNYWKLIIKTVFRETNEFNLKVSQDQLVLEK